MIRRSWPCVWNQATNNCACRSLLCLLMTTVMVCGSIKGNRAPRLFRIRHLRFVGNAQWLETTNLKRGLLKLYMGRCFAALGWNAICYAVAATTMLRNVLPISGSPNPMFTCSWGSDLKVGWQWRFHRYHVARWDCLSNKESEALSRVVICNGQGYIPGGILWIIRRTRTQRHSRVGL